MSKGSRPRRAKNAFIVLFFGAHVLLAVSCRWRDAKTWGWQMFANATIYRVEIRRHDGAGAEKAVGANTLSGWLSPRAFAFFRPSTEPRSFHRGRGLLIDAASHMPAFLCRAIGGGPGGFSVRLEHRDISEAAGRADVFEARCGD